MLKTIDIHLTVDAGSDAALELSVYSVVTGAERGLSGARIIGFDAHRGARVRLFAASGSSNFDQAVLLTGVEHVEGAANLRGFRLVERERVTLIPGSTASALPPEEVTETFNFMACEVASRGAGVYRLSFAVFDRDERGIPRLIGEVDLEQLFLTLLPF